MPACLLLKAFFSSLWFSLSFASPAVTLVPVRPFVIELKQRTLLGFFPFNLQKCIYHSALILPYYVKVAVSVLARR